ncbi:MAG: hypothetical protein K9J22_05975, partial [Burkholderiaceae bacterium]|nr:hypothetical protein [Burkholderiaceae bacterium]
ENEQLLEANNSSATTETLKPVEAPKVELVKAEVTETKVAPKADAIEVVTTKPAPAEKVTKPVKATKEESSIEVSEDKSAKAPAEKKARPARKPAAKVKPVDLAASGLQLVETKAETKAAVVVEAEAPKKPRKTAAWQKKADEAAKDEPLVIVQTQK